MKTLVLLLGAGFSKWAVGSPTADQLFDFNVEPWGPREARKILLVRTLKTTWDKLNPNGQIEQFIAESLNSNEKNKRAVL